MNTPNDKFDLQTSRDKITHDLANSAREAGELVRNLGTQTLESAKGAVVDAKAAAEGSVADLRFATQDYVHSYPWRAIGAAAVAGLVVGLLVSRR